jgi:hypothetical protein
MVIICLICHFNFDNELLIYFNNLIQHFAFSNQKRFNNLRFEYETFFDPPEGLPRRPKYVHESEIGIVESIIEANVSKVARNSKSFV